MNANRLVEEWRRQGRILEVEGANTVLCAGPFWPGVSASLAYPCGEMRATL